MKKIIILGGGLTGLAAATHLCTGPNEITILEKQPVLGGLAASFQYNSKQIPVHYHHVFAHDYTTISYLNKFALDDIVWKKNKMAICVNKQTYNFTDIIGLMSFDYLSFWEKVRYGLFGLYVLSIMNPNNIPDDLDAQQWLYEEVGKDVTDKLFYHLQARNKFGIPLEDVSAKQFAHRLKEKEVVGTFGYPKKGLQELVNCFERNLLKRDTVIQKDVAISKIDLKNKIIETTDKGAFDYDILVNTLPVPEFLKIAKGLPQSYENKLAQIKYCSAITIAFGTDALLSDHYWLNFLKEDIHMMMQHSWLFNGYGTKICWILRYGGSETDFALSDEQIKEKYLKVVKKYFPGVNIEWSKVFREKYASPIYNKQYFKYKPDYWSPVEGLYNAGVAVTYPKIRNMNTALESGEIVAEMINSKMKMR